jgi:gliding motility-associated-like protein
VIILHSIRHNGEKNNGYYDGLSLVALHPNLTDINAAICEGQTYYGHNAAGIYVDSFYSVDGSDSIRILNLTVINRHDPDLGADKEICEGDSVRLFPGNFSSYVWQDGSTKEYFVAKKTGRYSVMVANSCGSTQDEILITTRVCDIYFPSAFTPNKDGKNDLFKALNGYNIEEFHLSVYNRWGQKLFETNDQNKGWDGSFNNQPQDMGVYIWYCYYKRNNQYKKLNGTITLLR